MTSSQVRLDCQLFPKLKLLTKKKFENEKIERLKGLCYNRKYAEREREKKREKEGERKRREGEKS
jgi:hypothetical protein